MGIPIGTRFNAFPYPIQNQGRTNLRNTDGEPTSPDVGVEHLPNLIFPLSLKTLSRRRTHAPAQSPFRPPMFPSSPRTSSFVTRKVNDSQCESAINKSLQAISQFHLFWRGVFV